jgi:hypothetical protein
MSLDPMVDGATCARPSDQTHGPVPVAKGNGYGLGLARRAD